MLLHPTTDRLPYIDPHDPLAMFKLMELQSSYLRMLTAALAPPTYTLKIQFQNVTAGLPANGNGVQNGNVKVDRMWDGIIADITTGQIDLAIGGYGALIGGQVLSQPDLHWAQTSQPVFTPFPQRTDGQISLWADPGNGATVTSGTLFLVCW